MAKPKAITWLEDQTGQTIDCAPEPTHPDRHLSVRLAGDLAAALDAMADEICLRSMLSFDARRWGGWPSLRIDVFALGHRSMATVDAALSLRAR